MFYYVNGCSTRPDGSKDSFYTVKCEAKYSPLWWHEKWLSFTASGYGKRIPSSMMVKFNNKWRRVYVCQFSNAGTAYVGKWVTGVGAELTVNGAY